MHFARAHQGNEKRVLDHFALGVAAPDPREIHRHRFEDVHASRIVAFGKGQRGAADGGDDRARADRPFGDQFVQRGETATERRAVAGRRFEQRHVRIDESMAGLGKDPPRIVGRILPQSFGNGVAIGLQSPEQRRRR
ncbi:hypothetical protein ACFSHP_19210 [Novosphingobium panipatense]